MHFMTLAIIFSSSAGWRRDEAAFLLRTNGSVSLMQRPRSAVKSPVSEELGGIFNSQVEDIEVAEFQKT